MVRTATAPTGQERTFGAGELIVSKTDPKGRISYANDVFVRLARYRSEEIVGAPHNLIRHPDMPRGVFHLMWKTISAGEELFAVINNLAADGAHYWVHAHVTPTFDASGSIIGYHSNRRMPDRSLVDAVTPLYRRMLAEESRHNRASEAAQAGAQVMENHVDELGVTYDEYIWQLTRRGGSVA